MQKTDYICIVRISTSYHNKAICRRSLHLCPRFGEGFFIAEIVRDDWTLDKLPYTSSKDIRNSP